MKKRLLIISFSDISQDARVRKQVELFAEHYDVTTCGFGEAARDDVEHLPLCGRVSRLFKYLEAVALRAHLYSFVYRWHPRSREARRALRGRSFDAVLANDLDTVEVAHTVVESRRVHADLHEYFPGLHDQNPAWVRLRKPFFEWILRRYVAFVGSVTTVSDTIAGRYRDDYGFAVDVVRNAAPLATLQPTPVGKPIKLVHSGVAQENRRIEVMMRAAARSRTQLTLDLYLTGVGSDYHSALVELAAELGPRITVQPPVPQRELVRVLNSYDVGVFILPDTNTNYRLALPNKFFDYVQARLGLVISPTVDMERLLRKHDLGVVSQSPDLEAVVAALDSLSTADVTRWKQNAASAATENSAEAQNPVWEAAIAARAAER